MVGAGRLPMLHLLGRRRRMLLATGRQFLCGRAGRRTTGTAVVAHVVDGGVVDNGLVIDVGDIRRVADVVHRTVVIQRAVIPIPTLIPGATVAIAVVDATVVADVV